jgi:hypothetical protein
MQIRLLKNNKKGGRQKSNRPKFLYDNKLQLKASEFFKLVLCRIAEFFFDSDKLVVFSHTVGS